MLTAALIVAAALLLGGKDLAGKARELAARMPPISGRQIAAVVLLVAALASYRFSEPAPAPPAPPAPPAADLDLRGLWRSADDAATVAALCGEWAAELEYDATRPEAEQRLKTGVAVDAMRVASRELRCRGQSIGARNPQARDAIAAYLEARVGDHGGPLDAERRAAWVAAFREIERAANAR
jgi:hypothetical protein